MNYMRDPGAETAAQKRARRAPPKSLEGLTVGLFDIGKTRSDEFLDQVEKRFAERGLRTKRFAKPTNTKVAPDAVIHKVVADADVVLIALSD
jgi:phosphopantothenate synthetase